MSQTSESHTLSPCDLEKCHLPASVSPFSVSPLVIWINESVLQLVYCWVFCTGHLWNTEKYKLNSQEHISGEAWAHMYNAKECWAICLPLSKPLGWMSKVSLRLSDGFPGYCLKLYYLLNTNHKEYISTIILTRRWFWNLIPMESV